MDFQDVVFLPSKFSFSAACFEKCGCGESLGITTYLKTVVGVNKGMFPVKYFHSNSASFYVS